MLQVVQQALGLRYRKHKVTFPPDHTKNQSFITDKDNNLYNFIAEVAKLSLEIEYKQKTRGN